MIAAIEPARKVGDFLLLLNVRVRGKGGANEAIVSGTDVVVRSTIEVASSLPLRCARASAGWKKEKFQLETNRGVTESNMRACVSSLLSVPSPHTRYTASGKDA